MLHVACEESGNSCFKNRFHGLQMVQFEYPRVIHPLVSFAFWVHCRVPFSLDAGKGKCCMWFVNKVEIYFSKIGFMDCKWSNLNDAGSCSPWCHPILGSAEGIPSRLMIFFLATSTSNALFLELLNCKNENETFL